MVWCSQPVCECGRDTSMWFKTYPFWNNSGASLAGARLPVRRKRGELIQVFVHAAHTNN
jgi:hypothetical protein